MKYLGFLMLLIVSNAYSLSWQDLWQTKNQQALNKMQQEAFGEAEQLFQDPAWLATSAYRAKHYEKAAQGFESLKTDDGYYNQGNALAQLGCYQQAIGAYNRALELNPKHEDAEHNRKIINALLEKQNQNKQDNQSQQDNSNSEKSTQQNQAEDSQEKNSQDNSNSQEDTNSNQNASAEQQNPETSDRTQGQAQQDPSNDNASKNQTEQDSQKQDQKDNKPKTQPEKEQQKNNEQQTQQDKPPIDSNEKEQQQAKEQWLKLIPDDPGGLLRGKFLRDYHRRRVS